jgi:nucleotide-binding universal stress UspA family protein
MNRRVLIGLDGSKGSWKALRWAAENLDGKGTRFTVLYAAPEPPTYFWEVAQTLSPEEDKSRLKLAAAYEAAQERSWEVLRAKAFAALKAAGVPRGAAVWKVRRDAAGAADAVLKEAKASACATIVLGRRGLSAPASALFGSVTERVMHKAKGRTVVVVE